MGVSSYPCCWTTIKGSQLISLLLNNDKGMGVSSYLCRWTTTRGWESAHTVNLSRVSNHLWAKITSRLNNLSEFMRIFFALTLEIFLSDDKAFNLNFTSIVDVTDFPSSFICISLSTSVALPAFTASSAVFVSRESCWEGHNSCFDCGQRGCFIQPFQGKFNHSRISLHPSFSKVFVEWTMFLDSYLPAWGSWHRRSGWGSAPNTLLKPHSDLAAFINVCSIQMSHQLPHHSWQE